MPTIMTMIAGATGHQAMVRAPVLLMTTRSDDAYEQACPSRPRPTPKLILMMTTRLTRKDDAYEKAYPSRPRPTTTPTYDVLATRLAAILVGSSLLSIPILHV